MMTKSILRDLKQIFQSSVSAVLPEKLIRNTIKYNSNDNLLNIAGKCYDIKKRNIYLVGAGKAVQNMAREVEKVIGPQIKEGIISIPVGSLNIQPTSDNIVYYEGAENNLPDRRAQETALKIKQLASQLNHNDILLVLISGGGSALLPLPKEPISLQEKCDLVKKLANSGADIVELNIVRKRLSAIKGGQLAITAQPADVVSLILSDIVNDPLDLIASGPTTVNEDDCNAAIDVIKKYNLDSQLPDSIKTILTTSNEELQCLKNKVQNYIVGSNAISINASVNTARNLGYLPIVLSNSLTGNVTSIAQKYVKLTKIFCAYLKNLINPKEFNQAIISLGIPGIQKDNLNVDNLRGQNICIILGGEITVEVRGTGKGGRNQQLALEFSKYIHNNKEDYKQFDIYLLSAGTDGIDGPTDAAGAIGYLNLVKDAINNKIDINEYINNNNSYDFYKSFKDGSLHIITGHTNTNVMDIHLILIINS